MLKKASWLKNRAVVFGFCGGWCLVIDKRSIDRTRPAMVIINALSLMVFGMVITVVV